MNIGIIGASGYTGAELLRLLAGHPARPAVTAVTSRQEAGKPLTEIFPALSALANYDELVFSDPEEPGLAGRADFFFMATPHGTAMTMVPSLLEAGARVVDLSADFRLNDPDVFQAWHQPHAAPALLAEAVYGLPELYGPQIRAARLTANPGCYATSVILALAPLLKNGLWAGNQPIIADSASGVSGAGRGAALNTSFCETAESFKAYKVVGHRHIPEMEQELSKLYGGPLTVSFTPHLAPINRGILSTVYVRPQGGLSREILAEQYEAFYAPHHFVRIRPAGFEPRTSDVRGSNFCDISIYYDQRANLAKIISAVDNLVRGASGQALVNFNLMCGQPPAAGLDFGPLRP